MGGMPWRLSRTSHVPPIGFECLESAECLPSRETFYCRMAEDVVEVGNQGQIHGIQESFFFFPFRQRSALLLFCCHPHLFLLLFPLKVPHTFTL